MDDAALVRVERTHFLRYAARARLLGDESRHLPQLRILVFAEPVAVNHNTVVVAELLAKCGGDDVLQRLQSFTATPHENSAVLSFEVDVRAFCRLLDIDGQRHPHCGDDVLDELRDLWGQCSHRQECFSAPAVRPLPAFFTRRSAAGRTVGTAGGPISQFVKYCCAIAQTLLTNQYSAVPAAVVRNIKPNTIGMSIIIWRCVGSAPAAGVIFCCQNIVSETRIGMRKNGSGCERSLIHQPNAAPRNSIDCASSW